VKRKIYEHWSKSITESIPYYPSIPELWKFGKRKTTPYRYIKD
jgi:hypothetical protein